MPVEGKLRLMRHLDLNDTIVAISTPIGEGGIGIVRLSGPKALSIADKIFISKSRTRPSHFESFTTHYGYIIDKSQKADLPLKNTSNNQKNKRGNYQIIDEVILTVMRAPKSYTKEDIVEINCHSGIVPLKKTLDLVIKLGARLAEPGEFTKRAFLNGRIDLAQAEAVLDIVKAKTEASLRVALSQLKGNLSEEICQIRDNILKILVHIEASLDFPEEDIGVLTRDDLLNKALEVSFKLRQLLDTASKGIIFREGVSAVICGRRNVGKSSLLNALLRQERAIVSPVAGTTRDFIEERLDIDGIPLRLIDTAGIIKTDDLVEKEGVARSYDYINRADLILLVLDNAEFLLGEDRMIIEEIANKTIITVVNKIDLPRKIDLFQVKKALPGKRIVYTSATQTIGLDLLERTIAEVIWEGKVTSSNGALITNIRHKDALRRAWEGMQRSIQSIKKDYSPEFIAMDMREAKDALGEIVGEVLTEDLLEKIFSEFCIGK